jgi:hypothetical protein
MYPLYRIKSNLLRKLLVVVHVLLCIPVVLFLAVVEILADTLKGAGKGYMEATDHIAAETKDITHCIGRAWKGN